MEYGFVIIEIVISSWLHICVDICIRARFGKLGSLIGEHRREASGLLQLGIRINCLKMLQETSVQW